MSAPDKLRGGKSSELTKLKEKWRTLAEDVQEYWWEQLLSSRSQADLRKEMLGKLGVKLNWDKQLNQFRDWLKQQGERDKEAELMAEDERQLKAEFGDSLTLDQIREEVLKRSYARTIATGNFEQGLATVAVETKAKKLVNDARRYEDAKRSDEEKALALCLEDAKAFPEVEELFKDAFAALKKAKAAKR